MLIEFLVVVIDDFEYSFSYWLKLNVFDLK